MKRRRRGLTGGRRRILRSERLEARLLLANDLPYQNPGQQFDVNRDLNVTALDALQVINFIGINGRDFVLPAVNDGIRFPDVNGSNKVTSLDALQVMNRLGQEGSLLLAVRLAFDSAPGGQQNLDFITNRYALELGVTRGTGSEQIELRIDGDGNDPFSIAGGPLGDDPLVLSESEIDTFAGGPLADGDHRFEARIVGESVGQEFVVTVDTTAPATPTLELSPESDTAPVGDDQTTQEIVTLVGATNEQATIDVAEIGETTTADMSWDFEFSGVLLAEGQNEFTVRADDVAGNEAVAVAGITRLFIPDLFVSYESPAPFVAVGEPPGCDICGDVDDTGPGSVFLHNGEFTHQVVDLTIPGRGLDWVFARKYRSGIQYNGPLGANWDFTDNRRLVVVIDDNLAGIQAFYPSAKTGDVLRMDGNTRADLYTLNGDGSFTAPRGFFTRLVRNADDTFTERDPQGNQWVYNAADDKGLSSIASRSDRNGNTMVYVYAEGRLTRVIDTLGRPIDYRYDPQDRISEIEDFAGRIMRFKYNRYGDLVSVTSPAVTGTPNGNDFPEGKTEAYTYSSGFADLRLNHNLLTITAPNEVAMDGPPRIVVTYQSDVAQPHVDYALTQAVGGTNATNISAGGTISYDYEKLDVTIADDDFNTAVKRNTVTDRNGNITSYEFNQLGNVVLKSEQANRDNRLGDPESFDTRYEYNGDFLLTRQILPLGNVIVFTYDSDNAARFQQGNVLRIVQLPDTVRGGDQTMIEAVYAYEPIYNQRRTIIDPRGNDAGFVPHNGGVHSPERYTTQWTFDYQEGNDLSSLASLLGVSEAEMQARLDATGIAIDLGDLNGDGVITQHSGNPIRIDYPTVQLTHSDVPDSRQNIAETFVYNNHGQVINTIDAEGNVDEFSYFPATDPDGDGLLTPSPADGRQLDAATGGYLREHLQDTTSDPDRNSGFNPTPTRIRTQYNYDDVGNVVRQVDGRGTATRYFVNQLNQVVQVVFAAETELYGADPTEATPQIAYRYIDRFFFDYGNYLVLHQTEDRGNTSNVDGNLPTEYLPPTAGNPDPVGGLTFVDTVFQYDLLGNMSMKIEEAGRGDPNTIKTRFRYDANGNRVLTIHPEGNASAMIYDERDLVFQETQGAKVAPARVHLKADDPTEYNVRGGLAATTTYDFDANGNVVEIVDAVDSDLSSNNNATAEGMGDRTRLIYDGFDRRTSIIDSVGNQSVRQYDPAGNLVRTLQFGPVGGLSPTSDGGALSGQPVSVGGVIQPTALVNDNLLAAQEVWYDELNRPFQTDSVLFVNTIPTTRAPDVAGGATDLGKGNLTPDDDAPIPGVNGVTIQGRVSQMTQYDCNSRPVLLVEDDEDTYRTFYDGVDRVIQTNDPRQNFDIFAYDANHNVIESLHSNGRGDLPILPRDNSLKTYYFDSLNRQVRAVDNLGQSVEYRFDARNNLVARADANAEPSGETVTRRFFTGGAKTQNAVNGPGNVSLYYYDGLNRRIKEEHILTATGLGDGINIGADAYGIKTTTPTPDPNQGGGDGIVRTGIVYDANSNVVARLDDKGNTTVFTYDNLNRPTTETTGVTRDTVLSSEMLLGQRRIPTPTLATIDNPSSISTALMDAQYALIDQRIAVVAPMFPTPADLSEAVSTIVYGYDPDDNVLIVEDANDNEFYQRYDGVNRHIATRVFRSGQTDDHSGDPLFAPTPVADLNNGGGAVTVVGTNAQDYQYDGLSRTTLAIDNADPSNALVTYAYDSLSRTIEETQQIGVSPAHAVSRGYRAEGLRSSLTYPNDRMLEYTYDDLDRLATVSDVGAALPIAHYGYAGAGEFDVRSYPQNGTAMTYLGLLGTSRAGRDGLGRPVEVRHQRSDFSQIAGFTYTYDGNNRRLTEGKIHDAANDEQSTYDSIGRLLTFDRPDAQAIAPLQRQFTLDGVGNWDDVDGTARVHGSQNELLAENRTTVTYDANGNRIDDGTLLYSYDAWNRLIEVVRKSDSQPLIAYTYDTDNRQVLARVSDGSNRDALMRFYYDGLHVIEERDETDAVARQYVYGAEIDERLVVDINLGDDKTAHGESDQRLFYHSNPLGSVFALTDQDGVIVEGYQYDAYGTPTVFQPGVNGAVDFGSDDVITIGGQTEVLQPYLFTGRSWDPSTELYNFRNRYYDPAQGRFLTVDPIGNWGDSSNLGNGYSYVGNSPANATDPFGLLQNLQITIEVRFITLRDNFFERIGIDFDYEIDDNVTAPSNNGVDLDGVGPSVSIGLDPTGSPTTGSPTTDFGSGDLDFQFNQGSFSAAQPFGGFDPNVAASFGFAILSDIEVFFLLQTAQGNTRANVLQAPQVTLFNGQQATVADEQPVINVLNDNTTVQLPTFAFTTVSTTVSVPDGGTALLGGIKRLTEGRNERGVPILSKIPYVSRLFKNVGIGRDTQSLMMMVTPRIIIQEEE